ncbi:hypothetical protein AOLI_G00164730 [Acnodon oligacanthus]
MGMVTRPLSTDPYNFSTADSGSAERTAEGEAPGITLRHAAGPYGLWDVRIQLTPANAALQAIATSVARPTLHHDKANSLDVLARMADPQPSSPQSLLGFCALGDSIRLI